MTVTILAGHARDIAAALGVGGILWGAYASSGLPVPATIHQVEMRIGEVNKGIQDLRVMVLESRRGQLVSTRNFLRNERGGLTRALPQIPDLVTRTTMERRVAQIDDELLDIAAQDEDLKKSITTLR